MKVQAVNKLKDRFYFVLINDKHTFYIKQHPVEFEVFMTKGIYPDDKKEDVYVVDRSVKYEFEDILEEKKKQIDFHLLYGEGNEKARTLFVLAMYNCARKTEGKKYIVTEY